MQRPFRVQNRLPLALFRDRDKGAVSSESLPADDRCPGSAQVIAQGKGDENPEPEEPCQDEDPSQPRAIPDVHEVEHDKRRFDDSD